MPGCHSRSSPHAAAAGVRVALPGVAASAIRAQARSVLVCTAPEFLAWRPDFSSTEQASPHWTRVVCGGEQLTNALNAVDWLNGEPAVQVELCESCGFAGCESGGYVHVSRLNSHVLWTPPHIDVNPSGGTEAWRSRSTSGEPGGGSSRRSRAPRRSPGPPGATFSLPGAARRPSSGSSTRPTISSSWYASVRSRPILLVSPTLSYGSRPSPAGCQPIPTPQSRAHSRSPRRRTPSRRRSTSTCPTLLTVTCCGSGALQ